MWLPPQTSPAVGGSQRAGGLSGLLLLLVECSSQAAALYEAASMVRLCVTQTPQSP